MARGWLYWGPRFPEAQEFFEGMYTVQSILSSLARTLALLIVIINNWPSSRMDFLIHPEG